MRILVTGGCGYIGSSLSYELSSLGHDIHIIDNLEAGGLDNLNVIRGKYKDTKFTNIDLRDKEKIHNFFDENKFDVVIHLAAYVVASDSLLLPVEFIENNVVGTQNLLSAMIKNGQRKLIFASSAAVYGNSKKIIVDEKYELNPISPYGISKSIAEQIIKTYCDYSSLDAIALRYFNPVGSYKNIIGRRNKPETQLLSRVVHSIYDSNFKLIIYKGKNVGFDGTPIRDYIHIEDLVSATNDSMKYLMNSNGYYTFNIGNGIGISILQLIDAVENTIGKKISYTIKNIEEGNPHGLVADIGSIKNKIKWKPQFSIEDIIKNTITWEKNRDWDDYNT